MYDSDRPHPLLAQIPLTVSPFISVPTATTLPYTYKSIPSTVPPSVTDDPASSGKPRFVVSSSGHAAHPTEILASCKALGDHMKTRQHDGKATITGWLESIKERELAEKRRVAPGWLDRDEKILRPLHSSSPSRGSLGPSLLDSQLAEQTSKNSSPAIVPKSEAEELDRAFGHLEMK